MRSRRMTKIPLIDDMAAPETRAVFAALEAAGGAACVRFVGGCVRNALMGRAISDLDLAAQLTPDETEAALAAAGLRSVPTGKAFGTITAVVDGKPFEITSLREDVETDGRRAVVRYTTDWAKDAQRRDFYLNALYADIEGRVYDPTGEGLGDVAAGRVRFIGEAEQRIREDYLRILRFFRFHAIYGDPEGGIDAEGLAACARHAPAISGLSAERIGAEMRKLLAAEDPAPSVAAMERAGVLTQVLPGGDARSLAVLVHLEDGLPPRRIQAGHMHDQRIEARPPLGGEDGGHRFAVGGVGAQAIDGLGGEGDQPSAGQQARRFRDAIGIGAANWRGKGFHPHSLAARNAPVSAVRRDAAERPG